MIPCILLFPIPQQPHQHWNLMQCGSQHLGFNWFPNSRSPLHVPQFKLRHLCSGCVPKLSFGTTLSHDASLHFFKGKSHFDGAGILPKTKGKVHWHRCKALDFSLYFICFQCLAQLSNFLLLLKSTVLAKHHRLLLFPVHIAVSYPQGEDFSDFQHKLE